MPSALTLRCSACARFFQRSRGGAVQLVDAAPADETTILRYWCDDCRRAGQRVRLSLVGGAELLPPRTRDVGTR